MADVALRYLVICQKNSSWLTPTGYSSYDYCTTVVLVENIKILNSCVADTTRGFNNCKLIPSDKTQDLRDGVSENILDIVNI